MADSTILVKDANGAQRSLAADLNAGVYTPKSIVTGPITDAQLRATAVPVSGPITDAQLRATSVPVSGPITDAQLRATAVPVSGPVTDTQLRATAVPVSGPVTDVQLRASAVPVSGPLTNTQLRADSVIVRFASEIPTVGGTYSVAATTLLTVSVTPVDATTIRIYSSAKVRFAIEDAPDTPVADTLTIGGIIQANLLREVRIPAGTETINFLTLAAPAVIDIEFLAPS